MTLQNLKYMLEISNSHSFSKAAKNLFVSQSTLSAAVKELESDLGITILNGQIVAFPLPTMEKTLLNMPKKL